MQTKSAFAPAFQADSPALESIVKTCAEKYPDEKNAASFREGICGIWKDLRAKVLEQITPYADLKAMFIKGRCPVLPSEVNLTRSSVIACARQAQMIRNRYICLDLAWDLGCFETVLSRMEESETYLF